MKTFLPSLTFPNNGNLGLPLAAYGGKRAIMEKVAPLGPVYQAGTLSGNPVAVSAALATIPRLDEALYAKLEALSAREHQVFSLLCDGVRAKEIAARLSLSPKTVDTYRASLMRKLDIHDVAGLVKFAIQRDLTSAR